MLETVSKRLFDDALSPLTPRLEKGWGWIVNEASYPILDVTFVRPGKRSIRVRLSCEGWDDEPPSMTLLTPDGEPLESPWQGGNPEYAGLFTPGPSGNTIFNGGPHELTGKPFVCMRGSKEFHTYSGHRHELWDNYRGQTGNDLLGLLAQVWKAWSRSPL